MFCLTAALPTSVFIRLEKFPVQDTRPDQPEKVRSLYSKNPVNSPLSLAPQHLSEIVENLWVFPELNTENNGWFISDVPAA